MSKTANYHFIPFFYPRNNPAPISRAIRMPQSFAKKNPHFNFSIGVVLLGLNILGMALIIIGVNNTSLHGYEMRSLQNKLAQTIEENQKLGIKTAELSSNIQKADFTMPGFEPIAKADYLKQNQFSFK